MSWINGFELCRAIKQNEEFRAIPVVFLSARKNAEDVADGMTAGAADYFAKPVDIDRLAVRLRELAGPLDEEDEVTTPPAHASSEASR